MAQSGGHGIELDVGGRRLNLKLGAHRAVEVVPRPHTAASSANAIDLVGRERLPAVHDRRQGPALSLLDQHMDMRGHDAPSKILVTVAVEMQEGVFNDPRASGIGQETASETSIKGRFRCSKPLRNGRDVDLSHDGTRQRVN